MVANVYEELGKNLCKLAAQSYMNTDAGARLRVGYRSSEGHMISTLNSEPKTLFGSKMSNTSQISRDNLKSAPIMELAIAAELNSLLEETISGTEQLFATLRPPSSAPKPRLQLVPVPPSGVARIPTSDKDG